MQLRKLLFSTLGAAAIFLIAASAALATSPGPVVKGPNGTYHRAVCAQTPRGFAHCDSHVVTDASGKPLARRTTSQPALFAPGLQSAYNLPSASAGSGQTIAIVDAYDDPNAESDLAVYRGDSRNSGLLSPCTTANGCFSKVNQNGGSTPPAVDGGWAQEISLDLDMASAVCPNCHILLVEANSNAYTDLAAAVRQAATLGANTISNSYGGSEYLGEDQSAYNQPGRAVTVSSGDSGYGVEFPASSQYVTAVGGTSLTRNTNTARGWTETAWSGAGSGCSAVISKPTWQNSSVTGCSRRAVADVSSVADPNTGVAVYDSTPYQNASGWMKFGGTSAAAPVIAGVYALAGNSSSIDGSYPYNHASSLFDVTSGSNGRCSPAQLCTARTGWDGPTGLGTPNGIGGF